MGKILRIGLLLLTLLISAQIHAQNQGTVIKGTVTDDKGVTLPGATVTVKGTTTKSITDVNGKYTISVPPGGKSLVFSFIGMEPKEITIGTNTTINASLILSSTALSEVVVTNIGYGTQKRQDVNGAISSVYAKDIQDVPEVSVEQLLQGKAAGVTVTENSGQPGANVSVHIRGIATFGQSEPLYVIDGVEIQGNANTSEQLQRPGGGQEETGVSPMSSLNPDDIESIDILKDASASAIYGSRALNGVVLITTKRGKSGKAQVTYDGFVGDQQQGKFLKMDDLQQYATLENKLAAVYQDQPRAEFADPSVLGPGTNWQDAIFQTALEQSHNIAVSGGTDKSDYRVSAGYFKQDGTVLGFNFDRYTIRTAINSQATNWLKIGSTLGFSRSDENVGEGSNTGIIYNALLAPPDQAIYNADGSYAGPQVSPTGTIEGPLVNAVQQALSVTNTLNRNEVNGNMYGEIKFFKDLTLRSEIDGDFNWSDAQNFNPTFSFGATGTPISDNINNSTATLNRLLVNSTYWSWKETLNYGHTWGKSNLSVLAGREVWESTYDQLPLSGIGFVAGNNIQSIALANSVGASIPEIKNSQVMQSYLGRIIYTFNNKYSITANIRSDQTSNFAPGHQIGYFPGAAASWRLSEEPFMDGVKTFADNIKIRLGYGTTGNSNVPGYSYGSSLTGIATTFGEGFLINNIANPNLTWETAIQKDAGIDFSLLNNRIDASFDYFDKTSDHFLFQQPLPYYLVGGPDGYGSDFGTIAPPYINAGQIENKGFEFSITSRNIATRDFKWSTTLTFTSYSNKVTSLDGVPALYGNINLSYNSLVATKTVVGYPEGEFFGYQVQGVVKTPAQLAYLSTHPQNVTGTAQVVTNDPNVSNSIWLGDLEYKSNQPSGDVDVNSQVPLGSPDPDFTYGFTNNFSYKDFELSLFFYGSYGGKILDALEYETAGLGSLYTNQLASTANYWTPQNPNSNIPAPRVGITNPNLVMSDRFLESASYLRLQNARLGYNLPSRWARYIDMSGLKVFVSAQNIFVITKYPGLDPEVGSFNQNPLLQNVDVGRYPSPRVVTLGVNAQF